MDGSATGGRPHRFTTAYYHRMAEAGILDEDSVQNPVRLDDSSEPEPDVAVLKPRADDYGSATPRPEDVLLLVEVADSTLRDDRDVKIPLYAESGISECWLVDIVGYAVEVYRQPMGGRYAESWRAGPDGTLEIAALPGVSLAASDLFHPAMG